MSTHPLDPDRIEEIIAQYSNADTARRFRVQTVAETGSTNDDALAAAALKNSNDGLVIIADQQTVGRGRRGDAWVAPSGSSVLMSILIRPEGEFIPALWHRLPHLAGLALARAVERVAPHLDAQLKWPNDLYLNGRKVAGILVEGQTAFTQNRPAIVVGIGLNVNTRNVDFPESLQQTATSLLECTPNRNTPMDRNIIAGAILAEWATLFPSQIEDPHFGKILKSLTRRSILIGKQIELIHNRQTERGEVVGFGHEGELKLIPTGKTEPIGILNADFIRILPESI